MPDLAFKNICLFNMNQVNIVNIDILNFELLSHLILVLKLLTLNRSFLAGTNDITSKNSQNKIFSSI